MTAVEASPVPLTDSGLVKMEDRKRPAPYDGSDSAPPLKKQATSINGGSKAHPDTDMPWKDDLEVSLHHTVRCVLTLNAATLCAHEVCRARKLH